VTTARTASNCGRGGAVGDCGRFLREQQRDRDPAVVPAGEVDGERIAECHQRTFDLLLLRLRLRRERELVRHPRDHDHAERDQDDLVLQQSAHDGITLLR
jgi:hypothetical protein